MTNEDLDSKSIDYTHEFDAERPPLYSNNHEREVRESERQQAYQDGFREALSLIASQGDNLVINGQLPSEQELLDLLTA